MKLRKDDNVLVTVGKDRGKTGKVLRSFPAEEKVVVEGVRAVKKHQKPVGTKRGGIINVNLPIPISNVLLVCPSCERPTRVGYRTEGDRKVRYCKKCGEEVKRG